MSVTRAPDGSEWRRGPPDPTPGTWWWIEWFSIGSPEYVHVTCCELNQYGNLGFPGVQLWSIDVPTWPAGWRCAPVVSPAAVAEECARVAETTAREWREQADAEHARGQNDRAARSVAIASAAESVAVDIRDRWS
ncbi:MAG: hypothetical protein Q8Q14_11495 [Gemmatimonadales bacterium]|nr:hypothetical protein [Gemmatimonadales bacterium]